MVKPGSIDGVLYADSDEHTEEGHITESDEQRIKMMHKRYHLKWPGLVEDAMPPTTGNGDAAQLLLIGFGSTLGVMREISEHYFDGKVGYVHLSQVWPLPEKHLKPYLDKQAKIICIENNATGQLAGLLRKELGIQVDGTILQYDGRPFTVETVCEKVGKELA